MVILAMERDELLLRELRNGRRVAARLIVVRRIGVERLHELARKQVIGVRERTFHFIINHAAIGQRCLRILQLVVPALLHEDLGVLAHGRIEHCIEIDVHEILEVLGIAAGHGVHRLVRVGHRIQERIQRALHELDERLLQRVLARAAERRMLHDMRHARIVRRRRAERDVEHLVIIVGLYEEQARTALLVLEKVRLGIDFPDRRLPQQAEAVYHFIYLHNFGISSSNYHCSHYSIIPPQGHSGFPLVWRLLTFFALFRRSAARKTGFCHTNGESYY